MNTDLTEIICVVDRSGSMAEGGKAIEAINGFNSLLEDQKKVPGQAKMTYIQFDTEYDVVHNAKPITEIPYLTDKTYRPRGMTALLDAVGRTILEVGLRLDKTPDADRPGKVIVVILTDGLENSSHEFTRARIKEMVEHQTNKYGWQFIYLGADAKSWGDAQDMGVQAQNFVMYQNSPTGVRSSYSIASARVTAKRTDKATN
jgi:uncharacterized protein YegL